EVVVAQRLVRLICNQCKEEATRADVDLLRGEFGDLVPKTLFKGRGCRNCQNTGYRGRTGIFELMLCTDEVRSLILERAPSHEIRKVAIKDGMKNLREDGCCFVNEAATTIEEVFRNTKDEAMQLHNDGPKKAAV